MYINEEKLRADIATYELRKGSAEARKAIEDAEIRTCDAEIAKRKYLLQAAESFISGGTDPVIKPEGDVVPKKRKVSKPYTRNTGLKKATLMFLSTGDATEQELKDSLKTNGAEYGYELPKDQKKALAAVRSCMTNLLKDQLVTKGSHDIYSLTPKGWEQVREFQKHPERKVYAPNASALAKARAEKRRLAKAEASAPAVTGRQAAKVNPKVS